MNFHLLKKIFLNYILILSTLGVVYYFLGEKEAVYRINTVSRSLKSFKDIEEVDDSLITPIVYKNLISLQPLPLSIKKKKFIDLVLPAILIAKHKLDEDRRWVLKIKEQQNKGENLARSERLKLSQLSKKYRASNLNELNIKLKTHPTSIVLAQAALESGWGTSSFFIRANNTFGVWASPKTQFKIKANATRSGKPIYLRRYLTLSESIEDYYLVVARGKAYERFRDRRFSSDQPYHLISYLNKYSELGQDYSRRLRQVIRENDLTKYDNCVIDPKYIMRVSDEKILFGNLNFEFKLF